jgi:hypothetical protein
VEIPDTFRRVALLAASELWLPYREMGRPYVYQLTPLTCCLPWPAVFVHIPRIIEYLFDLQLRRPRLREGKSQPQVREYEHAKIDYKRLLFPSKELIEPR